MLISLLPEQVSKFWDVIKYAVEQSLPPIVSYDKNKMNKILTSCLSSKTTVWISYINDSNVKKMEGVVLTRILYDDVSDSNNLLIYALYGDSSKKSSWIDGLSLLAKYAKSKGIEQIVAYSNVKEIIGMSNLLGGDTSYTFISFDVNKIVQKLNDVNGG